MPLRSGDAQRQDFALQLIDELAIFRVNRDDRAEFARAAKAVINGFIRRHDGVLVRHEMLETVDAFLLNQRFHVGADAVVPPGHRDMETIVARRLFRPAAPIAISVHQTLLRIRDDKIDDHCRAASESRRRPGIEILRGDRAHERKLHVRMRINEPHGLQWLKNFLNQTGRH